MSYDPQIVGRYGNLVEKWAAERYPIDLDYPELAELKFDGTGPDGSPWEVKGTMINGVRPTFKFWRDQHSILEKRDGGYILVWYRARGREVDVLSSRSIEATALRIDNWTDPGASHHRSHSQEAQIRARELRP